LARTTRTISCRISLSSGVIVNLPSPFQRP
jgi:hypothetical protein